MKVHVPIDIQFDEEKIKEIADKIIERRTHKIIKEVWKRHEKKYKEQIEYLIRDFLSKQTELSIRTSAKKPSP